MLMLVAPAVVTFHSQVWNSQDTQSQAQVALWYPSLQVSMMTSTKVSPPNELFVWEGTTERDGAVDLKSIRVTN
jgi:hypothetical protein